MWSRYMKSITNRDCPLVLSIMDTTKAAGTETVIQRNTNRVDGKTESADLYVRAREIYFRARRHKQVRAASIF